MKVEIITDDSNEHSQSAIELLMDRNVLHTEIKMGDSPEQAFEIMRKYGWHTLPMVFVDGEPIGGLAELQNMIEEIVGGRKNT